MLNLYDPMNASQALSQIMNDDQGELEDDHLRKVLDEIDVKIGQAIEDKERDN